jgi:hypothetical protein
MNYLMIYALVGVLVTITYLLVTQDPDMQKEDEQDAVILLGIVLGSVWPLAAVLVLFATSFQLLKKFILAARAKLRGCDDTKYKRQIL